MIKPSSKKPSKQFINYLKDTPILPLTRPDSSKQSIESFGQQSRSSNYPNLIEGDFSKISTSYVLEDDRLRKKSILYNKNGPTVRHNQKQEQGEIQDIQMIKEIAKLEYLESKGYLKPDQAAKLQKLREPNHKTTKPIISESKKTVEKNYEIPYEDSQNMNPNICYQQIFSPKQKSYLYKMDQKMNPHTDPYYKMDPQADIYYKMHPQVDSYNQMKPYPYQQMEYFKGPEEFSQKALSKDSQPQHPYYLQQNFQQYPAYY